MKELVFLLEEESARVMLMGLMPRVVPSEVMVRYQVFEGKNDLDRQIARRIRVWQNPHARFIVLRDQDSHPDCRALKARVLACCADSGRGGHVLARLACRELESFYLADLAAVERAMHIPGLGKKQVARKFRTPDGVEKPSQELRKLLGAYSKVADSRAIGAELDLSNTRSPSFKHLVLAIKRQVAAQATD